MNNQIVNTKCSGTRNARVCPLNEVCASDVDECVCASERGLYRIGNVCREYLAYAASCALSTQASKCSPSANEECLALHPYATMGTCQCQLGYRRNAKTLYCEPTAALAPNNNNNKRRRPSPQRDQEPAAAAAAVAVAAAAPATLTLSQQEELAAETPEPAKLTAIEEQLVKQIQSEIERKGWFASTKETTTTPAAAAAKSQSNMSEVDQQQQQHKKTPPMPAERRVYTANLIADAGRNQHIYYPSAVCILNGTRTLFYLSDENTRSHITRWLWTVSDASPSFGVRLPSLFCCSVSILANIKY